MIEGWMNMKIDNNDNNNNNNNKVDYIKWY